MIHQEPFPAKKISLFLLIIVMGLIIAYIVFIALISINVGLNHLQQDGFWVPITAGLLSIAGSLWLFFGFSRFIIYQMKEKNNISNI